MYNQYPYLNLNDFNLDYILKAIKEMRYEVTNFVSINAIKYADPIQWDITRQYEKNTIVIDPVTGTAYISVAPVPVGVALTRPEYWTVVFDLQSFVTKANQNLANNYEEQTTTTATMNTGAGQWVIWGDVLYKALVNITAGDAYVVGSNIERITIEDVINAIISNINAEIARIDANIGDLADLTTTDKTSVVNAINEVKTNAITNAANIGDLADLNTSDTNDIVNAVNSVLSDLGADIGVLANLTTSDKTSLVNAINEVNSSGGGAVTRLDNLNIANVVDYGAVGDGITDDTQAIQDALDDKIGVYFPKGKYRVTSTLIATKAKWIFGQSYTDSQILRDDYMTGDTLQIGNDNDSAGSFIIEKLWFNRNYNQTTGGAIVLSTDTAHVRIKHGQLFRISDCLMWYCPSNLVLHACTVGVVERCNINGCTYIPSDLGGGLQEGFCNIKIADMPTATNGVGQLIHVKDCLLAGGGTRLAYNRTMGGVTVNNYWGTGCQHGIICSESEGLVVAGCYIGANSYSGITCQFLNTTASQIMNCLRIHDCFFDPAYMYQIALNGVAQVAIHGNTFNGQGMAYEHIWLNDVKGISICGNFLQYTYGCMIFATGATKGLTVSGNTFSDFCKIDTNHAAFFDEAIYADQTVDGAVVGNTFDVINETCYARYAVNLAGTTPQILVCSNKVASSLTETTKYIANVGDMRYISGAASYWDGSAWTTA